MTNFRVQAELAKDRGLLERIAACAAGHGIENPLGWAYTNAWYFATQDGWCCAISDGGQVSDAMIVTAFLALTEEPVEPEPDEGIEPEPEEPEEEPEPDPEPDDPAPDPDPAE